MQSLRENIHLEDKYPGITLAAINLPQGTIYIDAPPTPEDGRTWRADLLDLESGYERLLINLDANGDRVIGARAMDCPILAHETTAEHYRSRTAIFKNQNEPTGTFWETIPNLGNIRWTPPDLTFTDKMTLYWDDAPLQLEHHPGSEAGAIWVDLPDEKIVFVGDAILKNQPPFFATADIPRWLEDIDLLLSEKYQGYTIISGRGGSCATSTIEKQREILAQAQKELDKLADKDAEPNATAKLIPKLLEPLRFLASERDLFTTRLRYGLEKYYLRHYIKQPEPVEEE